MIAPEPAAAEASQHPEVSKTGQQGEGEQQGGAEREGGEVEGQLEDVDVEGRDENA